MSGPGSPLVIEVEFKSAGELEAAFNENILKGGYFVASENPAPRTTPVELRFSLPGVTEPLLLSGEVAFAATPDAPMPGMGAGMAIQFGEVTDQAKKAFKAAITIAKAEGIKAASGKAEAEQPAAEEDAVALEGEDDGPDPETSDDEESGDDEEGEDEPDEETSERIMARLNLQSSENLYQTIRQMSPHQKMVAAKRGNRAVRNILIQEGNKKILQFMLQNPQMSVPEVVQMLKMPNLSQEIIKVISKSTSWSQSEEVKYHLAINPKTPLPMALGQLIALNPNNLAKIAKSGAVKHQIKSHALKLLEQRRKGG